MKTTKIDGTSIILIECTDGVQVSFNSAIQKELYKETHKQGTYTMYDNYAIENRYIAIDTDGIGWIITPKSVSYESALDVINHYL